MKSKSKEKKVSSKNTSKEKTKKEKSKGKSNNKPQLPNSDIKPKNEPSLKPQKEPILSLYLGTYEGRLYVLTFHPKSKELLPSYSLQSSQNALRTIYSHNRTLYVSGTDEIIHIYDTKLKSSLGDLTTYNGSINDIKICKNFLIAACDSKLIPIWQMTDFNSIINLKGHKSNVTSIDIHKDGAFLVSCGRDKNVIIFDMLTGIKIFKYEFEYICNKVLLFHDDKYLICLFDLHIYIVNLLKETTDKNENIESKLDYKNKILECFVVKNKLIVVFCNMEIYIYNLSFDEEGNINNGISNNLIICKIEKPIRENENDLEIKGRFVSIARSEKIKIMSVVYSNGEIFLYDLNKILQVTKEKENEIINKYYKINVQVNGKITALGTEF